MMKRFLFSCLLALVSVTAMWAEDYPIMIGGVQVTSDNYQNITAAGGFSAVKSGAGTVTYDPATLTLTLSNAVIEATGSGVHGIYFSGLNNDYTLVLAEGTTNTVTNDADNTCPLVLRSSLTIEGGGACTFTGLHNWAISKGMGNSSKMLTIRNCSLTATSGIIGYSDTNSNMVIDNATVRIMVTNNDRPIRNFNTVTLTNTAIVSPSGAEWNETAHAICMAGSNDPIMSMVVISPNSPEETVEPDRKPNANYDVNKDGTVTLEDLTRLANVLVGRTNVPITRISLSPSSWSMIVGATKTLTPTIYPTNADYQTLAWTTSNKYVASVDAGGLVTGTGVGTCTITASAMDGSNKKYTSTITVLQPVTSITLSPASLSLYNSTTSQLTATVFPSSAANKNVTWTSSDASVATVSSTGLVRSLRAGTCTITCTATDGSGVSATCPVTVSWQDLSGTIDGHAYVDLALPSGTLWATTNVGASSPEGYGNYYAWGETSPKNNYSSNNYFDSTDGCNTFITYNINGGLTELLPEHDAAYVNWGSNWRMPSSDQIDELCNSQYTTTEWTTLNGENGRWVTSKLNGNKIFLPEPGYNNYWRIGTFGYYWSRTIRPDSSSEAQILEVNGSDFRRLTFIRQDGLSVRPVRNQ